MMRKSTRIIVCCLAILTSAKAQITEPAMENASKKYTRIFDEIIRKDTTCQVDVSGLAERPIPGKKSFILEYDPEKEYSSEFVDKVICSPAIAEERKIAFIQAALADNNRNIFKHLYTQQCECVNSNGTIQP